MAAEDRFLLENRHTVRPVQQMGGHEPGAAATDYGDSQAVTLWLPVFVSGHRGRFVLGLIEARISSAASSVAWLRARSSGHAQGESHEAPPGQLGRFVTRPTSMPRPKGTPKSTIVSAIRPKIAMRIRLWICDHASATTSSE